MPPHAHTPSIDPRARRRPGAAARKARFWDRIARKYAADPIADLAGYEATLRRVQGLLSAGDERAGDRLRHRHHRAAAGAVHAAAAGHRRVGRNDRHRPREAGGRAAAAAGFALADADAPASAGAATTRCWPSTCCTWWTTSTTRWLAVQALRPGGLLISKTALHRRDEPADSLAGASADARHRQGAARAVLRRRRAAGRHGAPGPGDRGGRAPRHPRQGHPRLHRGPQAGQRAFSQLAHQAVAIRWKHHDAGGGGRHPGVVAEGLARVHVGNVAFDHRQRLHALDGVVQRDGGVGQRAGVEASPALCTGPTRPAVPSCSGSTPPRSRMGPAGRLHIGQRGRGQCPAG
jgi:hypothetical protein